MKPIRGSSMTWPFFPIRNSLGDGDGGLRAGTVTTAPTAGVSTGSVRRRRHRKSLGRRLRIEIKLLAKLARDHALNIVHAETAWDGPESGRERLRLGECGVCTRQRRVRNTTRALFPVAAQFRAQAFVNSACSWWGEVDVQIPVHSLLERLSEAALRR